MEMQAQVMSSTSRRKRWNKGKLVGQKPPLRPKHVWSIRTRLQTEGRTRDLANAQSGNRQQAAGPRSSPFGSREQTRQVVDDYIKAAGKKPGEILFSGRGNRNRSITTRQYARLGSSRAGLQRSAATRTS